MTRVFAALSVMIAVGTFVAAQIDYIRRHYPGIPPMKYWLPQTFYIWGPGLGAAVGLGMVAFALERQRHRP